MLKKCIFIGLLILLLPLLLKIGFYLFIIGLILGAIAIYNLKKQLAQMQTLNIRFSDSHHMHDDPNIIDVEAKRRP